MDTNEKPPIVPTAPVPDSGPAQAAFSAGTIKGTRASVRAALDASALTAAKKAAVIEDIDAIDTKFDLLQVDFHQAAYKAGNNVTWTVCEL